MDLFDIEPSYPHAPGYAATDTSYAAAQDMKPSASYLQQKVLTALREHGPGTMEDIAEWTGFGRHSVQPRISELRVKHLVCDSGERGLLASGKKGIRWAVVTDPRPPVSK